MAIDTAAKRRSVSGITYLVPGVTPNASKPVAWRQQSGWGYSGIEPGEPAEEQFGGTVCATLSITPRVTGTLSIAPRVTGTLAIDTC